MKNRFKKPAAVFAALVILISTVACAAVTHAADAEDLMKGISASQKTEDPQALARGSAAAADFALRLYKACYKNGDNTLISPLSVLCALSMTANGAENDTLSQMEKVLGMSRDELNSFFLGYLKQLDNAKGGTLRLANSIWFSDKDSFAADKGFLQTNADYFGAEIYKIKFDGSDAPVKTINGWVKKNTDGMIPQIIDQIPDNIIMYLINALAFDAEWQQIYRKDNVRDGQFANADGQKKTVKFMYGEEGVYLETANATGFIKYYKDADYAFVALLPAEGKSVSEVLSGLDGAGLQKLLTLSEKNYNSVQTAMPAFECSFSAQLSKVLEEMGMPDAFSDSTADFSGMGKSAAGNIYISRVLHRAYISVNEKGTRAGAATAVEMNTKGANPMYIKQVYLDRPFVYMLIDTTTNIPFFIGAMENMK